MATYAIGIDLGTTNSVIAYTRLDQDDAQPQVLSIPQLVAPATVESRFQLPSFLYLGSAHEADTGNYDLPWHQGGQDAVGELARQQAAAMPMRTVAAAKSWLCHSRVDRHQPMLPWGAPSEVPKVSPVDVSRRYLAHLVAAWHHEFPAAPIAEQRVVLTVPASFDASARELTREAALAAGLPADLILLEEPQAALYAWLADRGEQWRRHLGVGDTLLVCDVGGGTTDFTLIGVDETDGALELQRLAGGTHTLVGGDNMDVALAHFASTAFADKGLQLDAKAVLAKWASATSMLSPPTRVCVPTAILWSSKAPSVSSTPIRVKSVVPPPTSQTNKESPTPRCRRHCSPRSASQAYRAACGSSSRIRSAGNPVARAASRVNSRALASNEAGTVSTTRCSAIGAAGNSWCQAATRCAKYRRDTSTGDTLGTSLGAPQG